MRYMYSIFVAAARDTSSKAKEAGFADQFQVESLRQAQKFCVYIYISLVWCDNLDIHNTA